MENPSAVISPESRHPYLLDTDASLLVVVDMQESFLNVMHGRDALVKNVLLLAKTAHLLKIPIVLTTQYAQRMGNVLGEILEATGYVAPYDKMTFSCMGNESFRADVDLLARRQIVLCGLETHICVSQTAHDLYQAGYQVHVTADAVSSRTIEKHKLGMERIRDTGIRPAAAEAVVYEWLYEAGTPLFKTALPWIR